MNLTPEEKEDVKTMLQFLVDKKADASGGHYGFQETDLKPFLQELVDEKRIITRETITTHRYFKINN